MAYLDNSGLVYLWSKLKATFIRMRAATVTLNSTGWTQSGSYYIQSVSVSGVTASNNIIVESSGSVSAYSQSNNSIGFRAEEKPQSNLTVKVYIFT